MSYFGGKSRWGAEVWQRFGTLDRYIEPFAGSLAVLLANPNQPKSEIVCDTECMIVNFWRAVAADPEAVAHYADWPSFHDDLTARHRWLIKWKAETAPRFSTEPDFFDAKVAGWWVWGISNWIGGGFCIADSAQAQRKMPDKRPFMTTGVGVQAQRRKMPNQIPVTREHGAGGVAAQRQNFPDGIPYVGALPTAGNNGVAANTEKLPDRIPSINAGAQSGKGLAVQRKMRDQIPSIFPPEAWGPRGVNSNRKSLPFAQADGISPENRGERLIPWMRALAKRLSKVVVLNRSWQSACTPTVTGQTRTSMLKTGIFMDPPYRTAPRAATLYDSDNDGTSDDVAVAAFEWAREHGETIKIAYCCHDNDFDLPEGWTKSVQGFNGMARKPETMDCIMWSPACNAEQQRSLFDE